tara:strand:- start:492 stop:1649 length:1158 start_codon:yes stop_codon:yes gene_type:complete
MIYYAEPSVGYDEIKAVNRVLKSKTLTQGNETINFERNFSKITKSKYSVSFNSCTSALISACASLNIGSKDEVWTTPNTFVASSNSAILNGAKIQFVDIDSRTFNMSAFSLEKKLKKTKKNKLPKAIISVHFAGLINNQKKIWELSKKYKFKIIEDCCHALGGKYLNETAGNCRYSHISVFSFHAIKAITTGEGGMATTNDKKIYEKLNLIRSHGITKDKNKFKVKKKIDIFYEQQELGYNFRLTEFQSALGNCQLKKLKHFINLRNKIAKIYMNELAELPIRFQQYNKKENLHAFHIFVIRFNNFRLRNSFFKFMLKNKIKCSFHYPPIYNQPYYKKKYGTKKFSEMDKYFKDAITLPIYPYLKTKDLRKIILNTKNFFKTNVK